MSGLPKEAWVWMPHAAHLIVGNDCRFKLATYVGNYVVSTVGEYDPDSTVKRIVAASRDAEWYRANRVERGAPFHAAYFKRFGWEEIGSGRTYETMVFKAASGDTSCGCQWLIGPGSEVDFNGYNDPGEAYAGHMALCEKWAATPDGFER